ncbi:MAG: phosphoglucosamine mutase [Pseudomonadota bacterium]
MGRLFGTDGIRGIFEQEPMTREMGFKIGSALVTLCKKRSQRPTIIIGRDTRFSGKILEEAVVSGVFSKGGKTILLDVFPTPGLAFMARETNADAGIMISASHNPYDYNGFKVLSSEGYKISDEEESELEEILFEGRGPVALDIDLGLTEKIECAGQRYISFLKETLWEKHTFEGMKIVLDCANGAAYHVAPDLFTQLGAGVEALFVNPDGKNINRGCGSQYPQILSSTVVETGAHAGLAFDGDGDRLIAVDEKGGVLTGDQILIICAKMLRDRNQLKNNLVISTVMSNMGFQIALGVLGINHFAARVGDRYVLEEMKAKGAILGGEDSGHIIFLQHHTTGDGLLTAVQLLSAMKNAGRPLSQLSTLMSRFPQTLLNVPVREKPEISSVPELAMIIGRVEKELGGKGRVLVRYSGTEPLCRIMVEGEEKRAIDHYANQIGDVVKKRLG